MKTFACLVGALTVVASCTSPTLTVTELGTSSPDLSAATDISDDGRIVGVVGPNGEHAAEFGEAGSVITAQAVSDSGLVIGLSGRYSQRSLTEVPFGWTADRRLIDFGAVYPIAVNASGAIVGLRNGKAVKVTVQ